MALEHARGRERMVGARRFRQRLHTVRVGEPSGLAEPDQLRDGRHLALDEYAGRIAVGVLLDRQRGRRRDGIARYAGEPERLGIGNGDQRKRAAPITPDRANENGVARRGGIELLARGPALLGKNIRHVEVIGRVADRHGDNPLARRLAARELRDAILDIADRTHASERGKDIAQALAIHVSMPVDDAGNDRTSF